MQESHVTNNHFKKALQEIKRYFDNELEPPEELFVEFLMELKFSNLLIAGKIECHELVTDIINVDDTGAKVLSLYTDDEEFRKDANIKEMYDPLEYDLWFYIDFVNDDDLDGIVINYPSECFFMSAKFLNDSHLIDDISIEYSPESYGPHQLKEIAESITNPSMDDFMANVSGDIHGEDLILLMSKATFLDLVISEEDFSNHERDGIIRLSDVEDWEVGTIDIDDGEYAFLFTSKEAIADNMEVNPGYYCAYQVTVLSELIEYVLSSDMDGIIINPASDNFFVPRNSLLIYSKALDNPKLIGGADYAFLL